ncbi:hypothetical protein HY310_01830 [Candidatus Microgenomates bacterium]|nr:hypothetical protein [Candidatus Microgenomates bacterium]
MSDLQTDAINAALQNNWGKAVELNSLILKTDENNIDCLNRLGKAYLELGNHKKACITIKKALKIDKYDAIALRNLARATQLEGKKTITPTNQVSNKSSIVSFLEEPGKTKLISLVNLVSSKDLLTKYETEIVELTPKRHTGVVTDSEGCYLGSLPDDIGHRLSVLIKGGNKYCAIIKSVTKCSLVIFVKEILRVKKFIDTPSFIANSSDYFSYIREDANTNETPVTHDPDSEDDDSNLEKLHADEDLESTV